MITIIILVILVGVTVSVAINGGLIRNTQKVASDYNTKQKEEQEGMEDLNKQIEIVNMKEIKAGEYAEDSHKKYVEDGKTAYIPAGFTVSNVPGETSIDTGLVIYSGKITNCANAKTTANQYVWIPVDNPSDMYGTDKDGNKLGKLYFTNSTLTDPTSKNNWSETDGVMKWSSDTSFREPAYLAHANADDSGSNEVDGKKIITEEGIKEEFRNMIRSIETYHGFYIGRYELTGTNGSPTLRQGVKPLTRINWYGLYTNCQKLEANNEKAKDKVHTSMIWGSQWDQAVKKAVVATTDPDTKTNCLKNPEPYGWYSDSDYALNGGSGTKGVQVSGLKTPAYNIFDMGGNVFEWTLEANGGYDRAARGGYYDNSASDFPACRRARVYPADRNKYLGCRPQLYL